MTAPIPGQTPAETVWVVTRAATHVKAGWTTREAIGMALRDLVVFYTEMAQQRTTRAKALTEYIMKRTYSEIRSAR